MKILIVEDEELAVNKRQKDIRQRDARAEVDGCRRYGGIKSTVDWLEDNPSPTSSSWTSN